MTKNSCNLNNNCNAEGNELVLLSAMVSFILANDLNPQEQNILGTFLQTIGQNLTLISAISDKCKSSKESDNNTYTNTDNT